MRQEDVIIGARVVAIGEVDGRDLTGLEGVIVEGRNGTYPVGVEFDNPIPGGHNCNNNGRDGYCRYGWLEEFELVSLDVDVPELTICFSEIMQL